MDTSDINNRRFSLKHLISLIIILIIILVIIISISRFTFKKTYSPPTALVSILPRFRVVDIDNIDIKSDSDNDGINDQKDILSGAKKQLDIAAKNIFIQGSNQSNYYSGGDPPPELSKNEVLI